jgi:hypothetical protein
MTSLAVHWSGPPTGSASKGCIGNGSFEYNLTPFFTDATNRLRSVSVKERDRRCAREWKVVDR